jgi:hypothetical protein
LAWKKTGGAYHDLNQGQVVGQKGPDGSVNRVRIVVPEIAQLSRSAYVRNLVHAAPVQ